MKCDFSGYATKNDLKCTDGRTIRKDAFKHCDGIKVPLVWQHLHDEPANVLGHAVLEHREDGVYTYGVFNDSDPAKNAKMLVEHGDITALSIHANQLVQKGKDVLHGVIREVSLVLAGANPGAFIDNLAIQHSDGSEDIDETEAIIFTGLELSHADAANKKESANDKTVEDVFNTLNEEQKDVVYAMLAHALETNLEEPDDKKDKKVEHSDIKGGKQVKKNVFDKEANEKKEQDSLTHTQFMEIVASAQKNGGSLKDAFLSHAVTYGIENIDYLFPDAKSVTPTPDLYKRDTEWVAGVINGTRHTPFSRIKSLYADLTLDDARAKGYVKGALKKEEFFALVKRETYPTTIYKKQKLDRDDIVDITDLDVVAWLKAEMRMMLDEEIARAVLVGDGRAAESEDKIDVAKIRPIYLDNDFYAHHLVLESDNTTEDDIDDIIRGRSNYKGSGSPKLYATTEFVTEMLLLKDSIGRKLYPTLTELAATLRVSGIVEVPVMTGLSRVVGDDTLDLQGIIVNLSDYTIGADKGGAVSMFDDFDIDYNQFKYLMETRCSGALIHPKSAIVIEKVAAGV